MPVLISDKDYNEYRILQHNALFQQKLESVRGMKNLKNDIDVPIRNLVAMFALLGCNPLWSCCGFDYDGQPLHKTHEYGNTYIRLLNNEQSRKIANILVIKQVIEKQITSISEISSDKWVGRQLGGYIQLNCDFDYEINKTQYPWSIKSCIHYCEYALIRIRELEQAILTLFSDDFADTAVLHDTNGKYKQHIYNWQYPILEDWIITKEDIIRGVNNHDVG